LFPRVQNCAVMFLPYSEQFLQYFVVRDILSDNLPFYQ
jgi:hypothetical protein